MANIPSKSKSSLETLFFFSFSLTYNRTKFFLLKIVIRSRDLRKDNEETDGYFTNNMIIKEILIIS